MTAIAYNPQVLSGNVVSGPATVALDVPTGKHLSAIVLYTAANNHQVTITSVKPYLNKAQTAVGSALYFVQSSTSVPVNTITLASTTTYRGDMYHVLIHKAPAVGSAAQLGAIGPVSAYGFQVTITTTAAAGSGSWKLAGVSEVSC